jgi:hypothetical protein
MRGRKVDSALSYRDHISSALIYVEERLFFPFSGIYNTLKISNINCRKYSATTPLWHQKSFFLWQKLQKSERCATLTFDWIGREILPGPGKSRRGGAALQAAADRH